MISKEEALRIAHEYASAAYRDLSIYEIKARRRGNQWYVDYLLTDPTMVGGGPHFIISAETGEVVGTRYEQ